LRRSDIQTQRLKAERERPFSDSRKIDGIR